MGKRTKKIGVEKLKILKRLTKPKKGIPKWLKRNMEERDEFERRLFGMTVKEQKLMSVEPNGKTEVNQKVINSVANNQKNDKKSRRNQPVKRTQIMTNHWLGKTKNGLDLIIVMKEEGKERVFLLNPYEVLGVIRGRRKGARIRELITQQ